MLNAAIDSDPPPEPPPWCSTRSLGNRAGSGKVCRSLAGGDCGKTASDQEILAELRRRLLSQIPHVEPDVEGEIVDLVLRTATDVVEAFSNEPSKPQRKSKKKVVPEFIGPPLPPETLLLLLQAKYHQFASMPRRSRTPLKGEVLSLMYDLILRKMDTLRFPSMEKANAWCKGVESRLTRALRREERSGGSSRGSTVLETNPDEIAAADIPGGPDAWKSLNPEDLLIACRDWRGLEPPSPPIEPLIQRLVQAGQRLPEDLAPSLPVLGEQVGPLEDLLTDERYPGRAPAGSHGVHEWPAAECPCARLPNGQFGVLPLVVAPTGGRSTGRNSCLAAKLAGGQFVQIASTCLERSPSGLCFSTRLGDFRQ